MASGKNKQVVELTQKYVMDTYNRFPIALVRGKGSYVWDVEGKRYLDFFSGLAVNNLGHSHPAVVRAIKKQAERLLHVSNLFHIDHQAELARLLCQKTFAEKVFFCNSGAEANEGAVKLARKYARKVLKEERFEVITMHQSFHGRTLGMITATGQPRYQEGFGPLLPGFRYAEFGNLESVQDQLNEKTCAILVEPIQGEGGVRFASPEFFKALRQLCDDTKVLLIFDEVQVGMGRTGKLLAHEHYGIVPDIATMAKALAGGLPIGALLATDAVARAFSPGDHAATFGGNPFVTAVGCEVVKTCFREKLLKNASTSGRYFLQRLLSLQEKFDWIQEVRGLGLILAVELKRQARPLVVACLEAGLLVNVVKENTIRILPPLTVKRREIDESMTILEKVFQQSP